jgi:hypothetical protein
LANVLRRKVERKTEDVLEEDESQYWRGEEGRDAIGMLGIISERTVDVDEELCVCYKESQKEFGCISCTKLMQI